MLHLKVCSYFKNKRITIMGLGILGGGVGNAKFLANCGATLTITDLAGNLKLASSLRELSKYKDSITYHLGQHDFSDFKNADFILKNPAVSDTSPFLMYARKNKVPIETAESLFLKLSPSKKIVAVTGTRGKSTTASLIFHLLKNYYLDTFLGGNMAGYSTLPLLCYIKRNSYIVLELSSWQLSSFKDFSISPHITVITNIYPDHLNKYKTMNEYIDDKKNSYRFQKTNDYLVLNQSQSISQTFAKETKSRVVWFNKTNIPKNLMLWSTALHNKENAAAALVVAKLVSIPQSSYIPSIASFKGLPGRLEVLGRIGGITCINDATSTTPTATIKALESNNPYSTVLILGGDSKRLPLTELVTSLNVCKYILLLKGSGTEELINVINASDQKQRLLKQIDPAIYSSLEKVFAAALKKARFGDTILFSPGFTSFSLFNNEFDRYESFTKVFRAYEKEY